MICLLIVLLMVIFIFTITAIMLTIGTIIIGLWPVTLAIVLLIGCDIAFIRALIRKI